VAGSPKISASTKLRRLVILGATTSDGIPWCRLPTSVAGLGFAAEVRSGVGQEVARRQASTVESHKFEGIHHPSDRK